MSATNFEPGDWVVYTPQHGPREDGEVVRVVKFPDGQAYLAHVKYHGDLHAKATSASDLILGNTP